MLESISQLCMNLYVAAPLTTFPLMFLSGFSRCHSQGQHTLRWSQKYKSLLGNNTSKRMKKWKGEKAGLARRHCQTTMLPSNKLRADCRWEESYVGCKHPGLWAMDLSAWWPEAAGKRVWPGLLRSSQLTAGPSLKASQRSSQAIVYPWCLVLCWCT